MSGYIAVLDWSSCSGGVFFLFVIPHKRHEGAPPHTEAKLGWLDTPFGHQMGTFCCHIDRCHGAIVNAEFVYISLELWEWKRIS